MNIRKHIPNLITLGNLLCGTIAVLFAVQSDFVMAATFVMLGIILDFFDGFVARLLNVSGELGKQLDSLADMVTSGVVPGIVMYMLIIQNTVLEVENSSSFFSKYCFGYGKIQYIGLLLTLAACYRLAKFNLDTRQTDSFIGLPTPAMALFVLSLPLILMYSENQFFISLVQNNYFLIGVILVLSYLMNAEIPLFSLKFKSFAFAKNKLKYSFLLTSIILILTLQVIAIPLIIVLYVLLSVGSNVIEKKKV